ncbi:MAG: three-Cys-motif partner protein TcmP [Pseudomonadota bacterium]
MSKSNYEWDFNNPPPVSRHTLHKHHVYEEYISRYLETVVPHQGEYVRISIVDGFCGGGIYNFVEKGEICFGSPVRIIETVRATASKLNAIRTKPLKFLVNYYFVDKEQKAIDCLKRVFSELGIYEEDGESFHIWHGTFVEEYPKIRQSIRAKISTKRLDQKVIFVLDQYAYRQVPFSITNKIMSDFTKAEILLTFVPRAFLDYAGKNSQQALETTNQQLMRLGLEVSITDIREKAEAFSDPSCIYLHAEQLFLQEAIARVIQDQTIARHFSKYFIQSSNSSRDLWIIHLANHYKAHDVMISVQWESANSDYYHPGYLGLPPAILGFDSSKSDLTQQMNFGMKHFDHSGESRTLALLSDQLPNLLFDQYGKSVTVGDLFERITNDTTCNIELLKKALQASLDRGDIRLSSQKSSNHRIATAAPDSAVIQIVQRSIILL